MYTHACIHVLGLSVGRTLQVPLPAAGDWVFLVSKPNMYLLPTRFAHISSTASSSWINACVKAGKTIGTLCFTLGMFIL